MAAGAGTGQAPVVLVVDDDAAICQMIRAHLQWEGYEVECAANGAEALEMLDRRRPDVILLDLWMPRIDGWAFRAEQRKLPDAADIPVVVLTASGLHEPPVAELAPAATLSKPFDSVELLRVVAELVESGRRGPLATSVTA
jgi:CheY-like chemotaxis protein